MKKEPLQQPGRSLSLNFTETTLRRAITAKHRNNRLQSVKELFTMKKRNILKQPAGAFVALAITIIGGAGVYAATNWFGGIVNITSDNSIMTVDLSGCQGKNLPPGIDENTDRSNVKFKITSEPHISKEDLQRKLLADCEHQTILAFYRELYGVTASDIGVIKSIDSTSRIAIEVMFGGVAHTKIIPLAPDTAIYDKGKIASLDNLKTGDYIMIAFDPQKPTLLETENPNDQDITVKNIFKTQYDLREVIKDGKSLYEPHNIMPLKQYEEMKAKGL